MSELVQTYIDRAGWPPGPWDDEPDRVFWYDETTGLPCIVKRQERTGHLCGYVGVPMSHPWVQQHEADEYAYMGLLDVHGGCTYARPCDGDQELGVCHLPAPGDPDEVFWFGFDMRHAWDLSPNDPMPIMPDQTYRDMAYVRGECRSAAQQAKAAEL